MNNATAANPRKILSESTLPVKAGDELTIGILVFSTSFETNEALNCRIQFLNSLGSAINIAYEGSLHSQEDGSYTELLVPANTTLSTVWSQQSVIAPARARKVILTLTCSPNSKSNTLGTIQCINTKKIPILDHVYELTDDKIYSFYAIFRNAKKASNIALLSVRYFDRQLTSISEDVIGLSRSERFGHFKYLHCDKNGQTTKVILIPPEKSAFAHIQMHPLIENYPLKFRRTPTLDVEPDLSILFSDPEWLLISPDTNRPVKLTITDEEHELMVASITYVSTINNDRLFGTLALEPIDNTEANENFHSKYDSAVELYGTNSQIVEQRRYFQNNYEKGYKSFLFLAKENSMGFIKKDVKLLSFFQSKQNLHNCFITDQISSYTFNTVPYWSGVIQLKIKTSNNPVDLAWELCWLDHSNSTVGRCSGRILREDGKALKVSFNSGELSAHACTIGSENRNEQAIIEFRPAVTAASGLFTLKCLEADKSVPISFQIEPFAHLNLENLNQNAFENLNLLETISRPASRRTLDALVQKYPTNLKILSACFDLYNKFEDQTQSNLIAKKILSSAKDTALCRNARNKIALMRVLYKNWLPFIHEENTKNFKGTSSDQDQSILNIAVLSGEKSTDHESVLLKILTKKKPDNLEINQLVLVSFAGLEKGQTSASYEIEDIDGFRKYYINCIDPTEADNIPLDSHLDFISLLASDIFDQECPNAIYVTVEERSFPQILLGSALSRRYGIPFFMEMKNSPREAIWDDSVDSFPNAQMSKVYNCIGEADTVITYSEDMTDDLIRHGISTEKILILSDQFLANSKCEDLIYHPTSKIINMFLKCIPIIAI